MRKLVGLAAASAVALGAGVWVARVSAADSATSEITLNATAEPTCGITGAPTVGAGTNMTLTAAGANASTVQITDMIDDTTATLNAAFRTLVFPGVCNYAHHIALQSTKGGLKDDTPETVVSGSGTFLSRIDYGASAGWDGIGAVLNTSGIAGAKSNSANSGGAFAGTFTVTITINNAPTAPVVAGTYSDVLKVQIGQQL